jgi:uncharacterized protein YfaS (alpha-2-macroglobulin family)
MKTITVIGLLMVLCVCTIQAGQPSYQELKKDAEKYYLEGSYAKAHTLYRQAATLQLGPADSRWVGFRLADTGWRSQAATNTADTSQYDEARNQLEELIREVQRPDDRDIVWAEAQESLGDFWSRNGQNWGAAWPAYQQALDYWSSSRDLEMARDRYLGIVWKMAREQNGYYYYLNQIPIEPIENAAKIASTEADKAHAHFLLAMTLMTRSGAEERKRVPQEFEAALEPGSTTKWYDQALFNYGYWLENQGPIVVAPNGQWRLQPDYVKALELFRRLVTTYRKGESQYWDQASQQIESISKPAVGVSVSNAFLPGSENQFYLSWRNVKNVDLGLYRVDIVRDVKGLGRDDSAGNWIQRVDTTDSEKIKSWSKQTDDKGDHQPGQENVRLDGPLEPGAYVIEARSGSATGRDLILVSDASMVFKRAKNQALVYFCDALDGSPIANGSVSIWRRTYTNNEYQWLQTMGRTNQEGIARFEFTGETYSQEVIATAAISGRQAFAICYGYGYNGQAPKWRVYAFTDRPAYRPGETVQWKFVARKYDGESYSTPGNQVLRYEVQDPKGSAVKQGQATLNGFGSAWGSLELGESLPLGEYRIVFGDKADGDVGSATLFRLEEYKLPEFKVSVKTPEEGGKKRTFRLGDRVEVNVEADYYFGGPVAGATVEVLVYQNPFYHWWARPRDYSWYYDGSPYANYYGARTGQVIKQESLRTDASGKATLSFETPLGGGQDFEYTVEARVTDASRREIIGKDSVRVTRQSYYVYPEARHNIYRPQDQVSIEIKTLDANNQPVQVEGKVTVTRDYWYEIWTDPSGREVKGEELKELRSRSKVFPPAPSRPDQRPWQLKSSGYEHTEILTQALKTDAEGNAEFSFKPEREGYYRAAWTSADRDSLPIHAETPVWVATGTATDLGYNYGGLQIVVDKDTFRAGQKAPVMLVAPASDRYVLFSVEGNDISSLQLVHMTGTVKLIELSIGEKDVPNIFLSAAMVSTGQIYTDTKQVIVPPVEQFLSVEVKPDRIEYQPRDEATLSVTTRDHGGRPVAAEVALGMVDESVFYIQEDYAGDPRKFYFGDKRQQYVQTLSSFQQKTYVKLVKQAGDQEFEKLQLVSDLQKAPINGRNSLGGVGGVALQEYAINKYVTRADSSKSGVTMGQAESTVIDGFAAEDRLVFTSGRRKGAEFGSAGKDEFDGAAGKEPAVQVRHDFRSTAVWRPDVVTDQNGRATVKVKLPDSLTTWTATARAATAGSQFGIASTTAHTNQPLLVRLEAPRFFVVGDLATVSAVVNNNTDKPMKVAAALGAQGLVVSEALVGEAEFKPDAQVPVDVPAKGEARVDWRVQVDHPGVPKLRVTARGPNDSDAMERSFVAYEHGIEKFISRSGQVRGSGVAVRLDIPAARKPESTSLTVQVSPSMAVTLLDALPYLIDYPYGCTEQTMSRFLPAAITAKTLRDLGLKPSDIAGKMFGGIEPGTASATHPQGAKDFDKLESAVSQGLSRLYSFQHDDGGWGWWKEDQSDHFMTAYVVWGLSLARGAGIKTEDGRLAKAVEYLDKELVNEETRYDEQAWMLHALAVYHSALERSTTGEFQAKAFQNLWENRDRLNAYTRALLALAAHNFGYREQARTLVDNLENGVAMDTAPDRSVIQIGLPSAGGSVIATAHWGEDGIYWRWSQGGVEATAFALKAMLAIDPKNKLVEPVTNWLIKNRRGAQWSNTRDTAICVLTLDDYLRQSGELQPDSEYELVVNGHIIADQRLTPGDALSAPSQFQIQQDFIKDGANEIRMNRKSGSSPIYFAASARFFSTEEPVAPAGNEIFARRDYYKLVPHPTLLKGYVYERQPLLDGDTVNSGERIETVVTVESKNNYEYLVFEDLKPAGFEAVEVQSDRPLYATEIRTAAIQRKYAPGAEHPRQAAVRTKAVAGAGIDIDDGNSYYTGRAGQIDGTGRTVLVHQELRDRKVAIFIGQLSQGVWEIRYDMRAEVPGRFHALPVTGQAMYVPEIRCNGAEVRIKVGESAGK